MGNIKWQDLSLIIKTFKRKTIKCTVDVNTKIDILILEILE